MSSFGIPGLAPGLEVELKASMKKVEELLEFAQLTEKRDVKVDQLSGGMKRRLTIARGLVVGTDPAVGTSAPGSGAILLLISTGS